MEEEKEKRSYVRQLVVGRAVFPSGGDWSRSSPAETSAVLLLMMTVVFSTLTLNYNIEVKKVSILSFCRANQC